MQIKTENLCFSYGNEQILNDINLEINCGEIISVLGPNGVGKTTLFKCLLGFLHPQSGKITIDGKDITSMSKKELASCIAYIPQNFNPAFDLSVADYVLMGITNQLSLFETPSKKHETAAYTIMKELGIDHLAQRGCQKVSGGERELMLMARALLQNAGIIVMDEPTANLDFGNTVKISQRIKDLKSKGYSVIISTHDPNFAISLSSRIITMKNGKIFSDTTPEMLSYEILSSLYNVEVTKCGLCNSVRIKQ